ncbi:MAG: site-2 protease family protein [Defluviitaleaceae bacterium]|nr:site-2 protease family protein [Defluviitaleaceae bacterium]
MNSNWMLFLHSLFLLPGAFFAPIIHEWTKARVSSVLGDNTPKRGGFMTMNPLKFFEPIGFFMMMYFQVGWGQPVPTSPLQYKDRRKGVLLTYSVPIVVNLLVGMVTIALITWFELPLRMAVNDATGGAEWAHMLLIIVWNMIYQFGRLNIILAVFNLVPIYPMAMNKLAGLFLSPENYMKLTQREKLLQMFLFLALVFGIVQTIVFPIANIFIQAVSF